MWKSCPSRWKTSNHTVPHLWSFLLHHQIQICISFPWRRWLVGVMYYFRIDMSGAAVWFGRTLQFEAKPVSGEWCWLWPWLEGCFLLPLSTVSSVTGQREASSRGLAAVKLGVHCGHYAGNMPLLIPTDWSARLFFFPPEWKSKLGHFWFPVLSRPLGVLMGTFGRVSFMGKCWRGEMGLFTVRGCLRRWFSSMSTFQKLLSRQRPV